MKYTELEGKQITLYDLCHLIYQGFGQDAVIHFCLDVKHSTWHYCEPCEWESPFDNDTCLVCGSSK